MRCESGIKIRIASHYYSEKKLAFSHRIHIALPSLVVSIRVLFINFLPYSRGKEKRNAREGCFCLAQPVGLTRRATVANPSFSSLALLETTREAERKEVAPALRPGHHVTNGSYFRAECGWVLAADC
jgi:hypothetical protein